MNRRHSPLAMLRRYALVALGLAAGAAPALAAQAASTVEAPGAAGAAPAIVPAGRPCASLTAVDLRDIGGDGSRVTAASEGANGGVATCTVEGVLAPAIKFRLSLPETTWTQRFLQVGCGGLCGRVSTEVGAAEGCVPLAAGGFAIAGTDMGHDGMASDFGRDPRRREDFAYRGVHLTAVASKRLIQAFYGRREAFSYFTGCSDGGREALVEAQRFPRDFNGIVAGAAAMNFQVQNALYHAWQVRANTDAQGRALLVAADLPLLHAAVLKQCDALDGQADGLVSDPQACHVDLAVLRCASGQDAARHDCFTPAQVEAVRQLYDGPRDPASGKKLIVAGPQPGSELAWAGVFIPRAAGQPAMSEMIALGALRDLAFEQDPPAGFQLADLRFDAKTFDLLRARHPLYDATNPDLGAFAAAHGKLIVWHGWADPHISPMNSIAYQQALRKQFGDERLAAFERLYLLPGVWHCGGGEGPSAIDLLTPMMAWVERGVAPDVLVARSATHGPGSFGQPTGAPAGRGGRGGASAPSGPGRGPSAIDGGPNGPPPMTMAIAAPNPLARLRPLYPYPYVAAYDGHGDANAASSYAPRATTPPAGLADWLGADFFTPYAPREH